MFARFDDLRPHRRRSFQLDDPIEVYSATDVADVRSVLDAAEAAVAGNRWVAGFVTYEAAPAFDESLVVRNPIDTDVADLPLAWFAVFERRRPTTDTNGGYQVGSWRPSIDEQRHRSGVAAIREHIRQGETYQVNHTFRLTTEFSGDPAALYRDLAKRIGADLYGETAGDTVAQLKKLLSD